LRLRLIKLAGVEGFRSLLSRALTLAKPEVPSLNMVQVLADGSVEGFDGIEGSEATGAATQAGTVLVAHLLELLMTFIGAPLISNIGMPDEDGYSLIAKVRALGKERGGKVPAAALTAYASEEDRIHVLQSGFQIHVPKPISPSELVAVVANLASRAG
jgi:CheY-like chemotaxis protein